MGRFTEKFFHDTPLRPFSDSPDGRTVIELHDRDKKASRFEERSLALQGDTLKALTQLHGGSTVSREDFLQNQQESHNLMRGLGHGIGELWREQASTTDAVEVLNQITMQASDRAHGDVVTLKESVDGVESAVSSGTREIHGPRDPQLDISFFTSSPQDFFEALSAYKKGMLTSDAGYELKKIIDEKLSPRTLRRQVHALLESMPLSQRISTNLATNLIDYPSLFIENPHEYTQDLEALSALADQHGISELRNFVKNMKGLLALSKNAQNTPLRKNTLVQYTNEGLLTSHMQHVVKEQYREARTGGSLVDINYSMLDLLGQEDVAVDQRDKLARQGETRIQQGDKLINQGDVAIQQREELAGQGYVRIRQGNVLIQQGDVATRQRNILTGQGDMRIQQGDTQIHQGEITNQYLGGILSSLIETSGDMVDIKRLVSDFSNITEMGFAQIGDDLRLGFGAVSCGIENVREEIVFARVAVVAELRHLEQTAVNIGNVIKREVAYGNRLLERMVWLRENSHQNDAQQFFEDGFKCLKRAATRADVEDAHAAFDDGTKKVRSSVENQYGAALAAELLDDFGEAAERYLKAANRSVDDSPEIASISLEGLARINQKQNNLIEAIAHSAKAVELNSDNLPARYDHARYLALSGQTDETLNILERLIQVDESYLLKFRANQEFNELPISGVKKMYRNLWESMTFHTPEVIHWILKEFLLFEDLDYSLKVYQHLVDLYPKYSVKKQIWKDKLIENIQDQMQNHFRKYQEASALNSDENFYCTTILAYYTGLSEKEVANLFVLELSQDETRWKHNGKEEVIQKIRLLDAGSSELFLTTIIPYLPQALRNWFST